MAHKWLAPAKPWAHTVLVTLWTIASNFRRRCPLVHGLLLSSLLIASGWLLAHVVGPIYRDTT